MRENKWHRCALSCSLTALFYCSAGRSTAGMGCDRNWRDTFVALTRSGDYPHSTICMDGSPLRHQHHVHCVAGCRRIFSGTGAALPVISPPQRVTRLCRRDLALLIVRKRVFFWPRPGGARSDVSRNDVIGQRRKRGPCAEIVRDRAIRQPDAGKLGSPRQVRECTSARVSQGTPLVPATAKTLKIAPGAGGFWRSRTMPDLLRTPSFELKDICVAASVGRLIADNHIVEGKLNFPVNSASSPLSLIAHRPVARRTSSFRPRHVPAYARCPKPVISAVHSACIGGGVDLVCATDIRLASSDAWFSIKEASFLDKLKA